VSATEEQRAPTGPSDYIPDPRRWRALSVTLTAGFMSLLDVSIVAVALPSIREGLGASPPACCRRARRGGAVTSTSPGSRSWVVVCSR
jgi:hypothetical protein